MALSEKARIMRNEYMRKYMQDYRKKHPSKKAEQDERYWENKALACKGGGTGGEHATLRKALKDALKMDMIYRNVAEAVTLPRQKQFEAKFLTQVEMNAMLEAFKGTNIYLPTLLAVGLGMRRGEVLGLQWETVDFENDLISVKRAYIPTPDGNVFSDVKTDKSRRTIGVQLKIMQYLKQVKRNRLKQSYF